MYHLFDMKRIAYYLLMVLSGMLWTSCGKDEPEPEPTPTPTPTPQTVAVSGITLNKTTLSLETGVSETLIATIEPENATNQAVVWSSSNGFVASVDNAGLVKAMAKGATTITVITADGGKTATCEVTVTEAVIAVSGIMLNKETLTLVTGDSETLSATVAPENATNKDFTWSSSNPAIATVDDDGYVTALQKGVVVIAATTTDGDHTATCEVTVEAKYYAAFKFDGKDYKISNDKTCIFTKHADNYYVVECSDAETKQALSISIAKNLVPGGSYDIYSGSPYVMTDFMLLFSAGETITEGSFWTDDLSQEGIIGKLTITELTDDLLAGTFTCRTMRGEITDGVLFVRAREWD